MTSSVEAVNSKPSFPSLGGRAQEITWQLYNDPLCPPPQKILLQITGTLIHLVARVIDCVFTLFLVVTYALTGTYYKISNLVRPIQDSKSDQLFERAFAFSDLLSNYFADIPLCLINLISPKIYREQFSIEETTHAFSTCSSPIPGFENLGANCAFNSCLQIILHHPEWRNIYKMIAEHYSNQDQQVDKDCGENMLAVLTTYDDACTYRKAISSDYSQKFRLVLHHLNPQIEKKSRHEDAHEVFITLVGEYEKIINLQKGEEHLLNTSYIHFKNMLTKYYKVGKEVDIPNDIPSCLSECNTLTKEEVQWQLQIELSAHKISPNFNELLQTFFNKKEEEITFSENSAKLMKDEKCVQVELIKEERKFAKKPTYLAIQFARFSHDERGPSKIHTLIIDIPEQLDTTSLAIKDSSLGKYELTSFIVHSGTLNSGHYIAYLKKEDQWIKCDDESTSYTDKSDVLQDLSNSYMCFYKLKTD
ncbi:MAG: ubiquitin carboxyl-terminal hydrolase [Candidatus Rhabdochlamydia sp.]